MTTIRQLRAELGEVLHIDYAARVLVCVGGDLVRDLAVVSVERDGDGRWRAGARDWAAYARAAYGEAGEAPVMTWEEAADVLGVSASTLRRRRAAVGDVTEPPWRSSEAVRRWWRDLVAPTRDKKPSTPPRTTTLADLEAGQKRRA